MSKEDGNFGVLELNIGLVLYAISLTIKDLEPFLPNDVSIETFLKKAESKLDDEFLRSYGMSKDHVKPVFSMFTKFIQAQEFDDAMDPLRVRQEDNEFN